MKKIAMTLTSLLIGAATLPLAAQALNQPEASRPFRVVIDAGHGGADPGAVTKSFVEKNANLQLAYMLKKELEAAHIQVILTRSTDREIMLDERVETARQARPDCLVSLHTQSQQEKASVYALYYQNKDGKAFADQLATSLRQEISPTAGETRETLEQHDFYVLRETALPAVMVSSGIKTLSTSAQQTKLVHGITRGILAFARLSASKKSAG